MKRIFDIIFSVIFLLIPFVLAYIILAPVIKLTSKGPVIFKQKRFGKGKKIFYIYKFRSMYLNDDESCEIKDDPRVTPVGKFIRKIKIDELPQVLNILNGEMSLVGPRPYSIMAYQEASSLPFSDCRYSLQPGLTGLAYVVVNNEEEKPREVLMQEWVDADKKYLLTKSITLDIKIIWKTVVKIVKRVRKYS